MFKLKKGNVFEKINNMDRKQAYTIGAIVAVVIVALLMLGSLMGDTSDDSSLDNFQARGYDLAAMPFINDEAEQLLLSSKYPDMQGDRSSLLFSQEEKEERQEADAEGEDGEDEEEFDEGGDEESEGSSAGYSSGGRSGGGYSGGHGGRGGRGRTEVGRLGGASMGRSGGSGMSGSFGAPRGDYSPYKTEKKGEEKPIEFKNQDARRALSQFAKGSRAAAGLRDGKLANAKRALQGGDILGSEAFAGNGVDLSKTNGLALDTNAPIGSNPDLSNLKDKVASEAKKADDKQKEKDKEKEKGFFDKLLSAVGDAMINSIANAAGDLMNMGWNSLKGGIASAYAKNKATNQTADFLKDSYGQYQSLVDYYGKNGEPDPAAKAAETLWSNAPDSVKTMMNNNPDNLANTLSYAGTEAIVVADRTTGKTTQTSAVENQNNTVTIGEKKEQTFNLGAMSRKEVKEYMEKACFTCSSGLDTIGQAARSKYQTDYNSGYIDYTGRNNNNNNGRGNNGQKCSSGWKVDAYGNSYCS